MTTINSNQGALLAQKFLRSNAADATGVQNRVSSGLRVSSATDDASTFAVAAGARADIKAYTAAASALQGSEASANVAIAAGEAISQRLGDIKAKVVQLADESISAETRSAYNADLASMVSEVNTMLERASFNGRNLLGAGGTDVSVPSGPDGATVVVRDNDVAALALPPVGSASDARSVLETVGAFGDTVNTALANLGSDLSRVQSQAEFARQSEEAVQAGLGSLVDADLARESAALASLQVRQQLGTQSYGIANQAPSTLLGLFR
jgi:flagellin